MLWLISHLHIGPKQSIFSRCVRSFPSEWSWCISGASIFDPWFMWWSSSLLGIRRGRTSSMWTTYRWFHLPCCTSHPDPSCTFWTKRRGELKDEDWSLISPSLQPESLPRSVTHMEMNSSSSLFELRGDVSSLPRSLSALPISTRRVPVCNGEGSQEGAFQLVGNYFLFYITSAMIEYFGSQLCLNMGYFLKIDNQNSLNVGWVCSISHSNRLDDDFEFWLSSFLRCFLWFPPSLSVARALW